MQTSYSGFLNVVARLWAIILLLFSIGCKPDPVTPAGSDGGDLEYITYAPEPYTITKPANFPEVPVPPNNPMTKEGVQLGRRLFYDPILSSDSSVSCSSCHLPAGNFTDNLAVSRGVNNQFGRRSSMSLLNIAYAQNGLFWDGRTASLEAQALLPVEDPVELHHTWPEVVEKLKKHPKYPEYFRKAFGINDKSEITKELVAKAISQFERILISKGSRYDEFFNGNREVYDDEELDGFIMFFFELANGSSPVTGLPDAQCAHCHGGIMFTGNQYFSNGLDAVSGYNDYTDKGRGAVTGKEVDNGKFRAPSLRNIALSAPYMHDGRFKTLEEVLEHYGNHGNSLPPYADPLMTQIGKPTGTPGKFTFLTAYEKKAVIKFLHTLTDTAFVNNPDIQNPF